MSRRAWPDYAAVWRWHFYAGILCIPFVVVLAVTGTIYLFRPQIEAWQERDFDRLPASTVPLASYADQVRSAVDSVEGGRLASLQRANFANSSDDVVPATRVIVEQNRQKVRVYVDPRDARVLGSVVDRYSFISVVKRIHGELLLGKRGSYIVELAASWTIVMVVTGLVLWLPAKLRPAGVLYPRMNRRGKTFWKDMHSVGGFWASGLILFLVSTGLPWSIFWGDYLKSIRQVSGTAAVAQHWDGGHGEHAGHDQSANSKPKPKAKSGPSWMTPAPDPSGYQLNQIDSVTGFAKSLDFMPPIVISPPSGNDSVWSIKSETANRPHQQTIRYDAIKGESIGHEKFADRHWVDRMVGQGIALHEGQRFGWPNQLIALVATSALVMLSCSGLILWWRRRDGAGLSPPAINRSQPTTPRIVSRSRFFSLACVALALAVYLPLFGASLVLVLVLDWIVFSRVEPIAIWLGRKRPVAIASLIVLTFVVGCSDGPTPITGGTRGTLTSGSKPISQMQVNVFAGAAGESNPIGRGYVDAEGGFELVTADSSGPLQLESGAYRFTVESIGAEVTIPPEYTRPSTTPLKVEYEPEQTIALELPRV